MESDMFEVQGTRFMLGSVYTVSILGAGRKLLEAAEIDLLQFYILITKIFDLFYHVCEYK